MEALSMIDRTNNSRVVEVFWSEKSPAWIDAFPFEQVNKQICAEFCKYRSSQWNSSATAADEPANTTVFEETLPN